MKRIASWGKHFAFRALCAATIAAVLAVCFALPVRANKKSDARDQFEHAVKLRTMLEGYLEKDRTLSDYRQTISAYHKVYLISTQAEEVTPSLVAEGELYQEMGRLFDPKYFQSAIEAYNFLLKQYPESRYRGEALLAIAQIQKDDLDKPADAEASYKEYVKRFPRSDKANDAREALKEIAADAGRKADQAPDEQGPRVEPRVSDRGTPSVKGVQTWNAADSTHIVVTLDDTIKYDVVRIASPDRIYFDLYKAKLGAKLPGKPIDIQSGLLKSVRVAQNKQTVVRLVLDVDGAKDYSAYLLAKPYRLVIDVHAKSVATAKNVPAPAPAPAAVSETVSVSSTRKLCRPAAFREHGCKGCGKSHSAATREKDSCRRACAAHRTEAHARRRPLSDARAGAEDRPHRDRRWARGPRHGNDRSARSDGKRFVPRCGAAPGKLDRPKVAGSGRDLHA